jgi:hypothetical protein
MRYFEICVKYSNSKEHSGYGGMFMVKGEITSEVLKEIGVLSTSKSGWNREVNIVRWNGGTPKLDIRDWAPEHEKAGKGLTLTGEEVAVLKELLAEYDPYEAEGK